MIRFLARFGILLLALATFAACTKPVSGPEKIVFGRDMCEMCRMIISDAHYAAEVRGGADKKLYKFDDLGDAVHWLSIQPWAEEAATEFWVMDSETGEDWLDAYSAFYIQDVLTPMDYGIAAVSTAREGAFDYSTMTARILELGLSSRCEIPLDSL